MGSRIAVPKSPARKMCAPDSLPPVQKVLIIGHGDIAVRQNPTYEHWLRQAVEIHCADIDPEKLDDCDARVNRYVLPADSRRLHSLGSNYFDLLCVNNVPQLHLATALEYAACGRQIIIQKPLDMNLPLIDAICGCTGFDDFRDRVGVHVHYRNKGPVPALLRVLPELHSDYGLFRRLIFVLTEAQSVNEESDRASSLSCGMIHDLGFHMVDLLLEFVGVGSEWRDREDSSMTHRRLSGTTQLVGCAKLRMKDSILGCDVETFAALDFKVTEVVESYCKSHPVIENLHEFDALIVVGKGLVPGGGSSRDLKLLVVEYETEGGQITVDLGANAGVCCLDQYLLQHKMVVNKRHGGLNRPLMVLSPNPPEHALQGVGGHDYPQWQTFEFARSVVANIETARRTGSSGGFEPYEPQESVETLLRGLADKGQIRPIWDDVACLREYAVESEFPEEHYD